MTRKPLFGLAITRAPDMALGTVPTSPARLALPVTADAVTSNSGFCPADTVPAFSLAVRIALPTATKAPWRMNIPKITGFTLKPTGLQ